MDLEKYRVLFVDEATDHLAEMSRALDAVERGDAGAAGRGSGDESAIDTLFRMAHSIKGMAASLDYGPVSALSHRLEDWLQRAREAGQLPPEGVRLVYETISALEVMVAAVSDRQDLAARDDLLARLAGEDAPDAVEGADPKARNRPCLCSRGRFESAQTRSIGFSRRSES